MAHKKATGAVKNVKDSNPQYRGVKVFGGQQINAGGIIVRQAGAKYKLGANVYEGNDFTIHAAIDGVVGFSKKKNSEIRWKEVSYDSRSRPSCTIDRHILHKYVEYSDFFTHLVRITHGRYWSKKEKIYSTKEYQTRISRKRYLKETQQYVCVFCMFKLWSKNTRSQSL